VIGDQLEGQPPRPRLPLTQSYSEILREQAGVTCLRRTTPKFFASKMARREESEISAPTLSHE
jgi:hypothetical protein